MPACATALQAVSSIRSGSRVFVHGAAATPRRLLEALIERAPELRDVELIHLHTSGPADYARPHLHGSFKVTNLFVGANVRREVDFDRVDYLPCFLSEMPALFRSGRRRPDTALIHVSPPDENGFCSLGTSVDIAKAAVETASHVIAQVNHQMPRVHGDGFVHVSRIDDFIEIDEPLPVELCPPPGESEMAIGRWVATLVENGATLQMGIGSVPNAVLSCLRDHRHLGIHTETWSDGALELIKCGAVDNSRKRTHVGKTVSTFLSGSDSLYRFVHDNPSVVQMEASLVNDVRSIAANPKVVAINSAVEIDLSGQVCADSVGSRVISGVGGQMDFIRGASLSEGGKPIIALTSRSRNGSPRIVSRLHPGAGVVTTRSHVHIVVTEFGIADLYGRTLGERARELIKIAHPDDRGGLEREWHEVLRSN